MVYKALEILSIIANSVALLTALGLSVTVLVKSLSAKSMGLKVNAEEFASHESIFSLVKSCARSGFFFQLLAWLMFSVKKTKFIKLSTLTYDFAVLWAVLCIVTLVLGIVSRFINEGETGDVLLKKKSLWYLLYSILYFVVTFLIY